MSRYCRTGVLVAGSAVLIAALRGKCGALDCGYYGAGTVRSGEPHQVLWAVQQLGPQPNLEPGEYHHIGVLVPLEGSTACISDSALPQNHSSWTWSCLAYYAIIVYSLSVI